jgi:phytoene desaturase
LKAVVIGAGIGGIATAIRLAHKGYDTHIFESSTRPGGKLRSLTLGKYRFDMGPSLFTMPHWVDELFRLCGEDPRTHFNYNKLPVVCKYFWEDGTCFGVPADADEFAVKAAAIFGLSAEKIKEHLALSADLYNLTASTFLERSLHQVKTWMRKDVLHTLTQVHKLHLGKTLNELHVNSLKDHKLVQLFNRYATYNGSSPYRAPALMHVIPHLENHFGAWFPERGMYGIVEALFGLAKRKGVTFHFNTPVQGIVIKNKKAIGIATLKGDILSDVVVSNADVWSTYRHLLPKEKAPEKILHRERSSSAFIFYWGINRIFSQLDVHNILFSNDYRREFEQLFSRREYPDDPTVYLHICSKVKPDDAPAGSENWFVMVNAPHLTHLNREVEVSQLREQVLQKIERVLGVDLRPHIEVEETLSPEKIQNITSSHLGSLYGTASNDKWSAFLRHPNFTHRIRGLYFTGGSVHPGGGIPLCLQSAKIVAQMIPNAH